MSTTMEEISIDELEAPVEADKDVAVEDGKLPVEPFDAELLTKFLDAKKSAADFKKLEDMYGDRIRILAEAARLDVCRERKSLTQSISLGGRLRYTCVKRWSAIKPDRFEDIARAFNGKFSTYFREEKDYSLDRKVLADKKGDPAIVAAFQLLRKAGILTQSRLLKPTEILFQDYNFNADVRALALARGIVPQTQLALLKSVSAR